MGSGIEYAQNGEGNTNSKGTYKLNSKLIINVPLRKIMPYLKMLINNNEYHHCVI